MEIKLQPMRDKNKPTMKVGDTFPNQNIPDGQVVIVVGYGDNKNVKIKFPDGRFGFGAAKDIRNGTTRPEDEK